MNAIVKRQITIGVLVSLVVVLILMLIVFTSFPLANWSSLWEKKVMELPFVVFVAVITVIGGVVAGLLAGLFWRKELETISLTLDQVVAGNKLSASKLANIEELNVVWEKLEDVQHHIYEQTKLSQRLTNERVEAQEKDIQKVISEERNRLARELHDSVSQELFAASMLVSAINETQAISGEHVTKQLRQVEAMIHQSQLEMRALLLHLRPAALKDKTLQEGMRQLMTELKQKVPLDITWKIESIALDKGIEDHLFRILQESVSNTLRHAKARALDVLLIKREEFVILRVTDDGIGFNVEQSQSGSYGLQNMNERATDVGASLRVISVPNKGTRIEVRVPMIDMEGEAHD